MSQREKAEVVAARMEKELEQLKKSEAMLGKEIAQLQREGKGIQAQSKTRQYKQIKRAITAKEKLIESLGNDLVSHSIAEDVTKVQAARNSLADGKRVLVESINIAKSEKTNMDSRVTDRQLEAVMSVLNGGEIDEEENVKDTNDLIASLMSQYPEDTSISKGTVTNTPPTTTPTTTVRANNHNKISEMDRLLDF